ncbi:hypothetical protein ACFL0E_01135 [Nanoarchaeota archaeon]
MVKFTDEKKSSITRLFNFTIYVLDYIYKEMAAIPRDFLTEIHLRFFRHNKKPNKKILGYWDFNQRLARLGDFMVFLENLNVLRHEFNINKKNRKNIDICFIEDDTHPNSKQLRFSKSYQFKKTIKSAVVINQHIDSVFTFKSNAEFERFYQQNRRRYIRWPPTVSCSNAYDCRRIEKFYNKNKFIPFLNMPVEITSKIYKFYESYVYPSLPIVLNIRNNSDRGSYRNFNSSEFKKFLKHYEKNKSYKFIIVCNKSEIPEELREFSNVIFSKDYFDSLEYDLSFIQSSYLSIFPSSGMAQGAWHSDVPFIQIFPEDTQKKMDVDKFTIKPNGEKNAYLKGHQRMYYRKFTSKLLISTFENLINYLEKNNINNNLKNKVKDNKKYESTF